MDDEDEVCSVSICVVCPCICRIRGCVVGYVICIHMFHFSFVGCVIDIWLWLLCLFQSINQSINQSFNQPIDSFSYARRCTYIQ